MRLVEQTPDQGHCWARYTFRPWPGAGELWLDFFSRGLGKATRKGQDLDIPAAADDLDDVVYLPPVDESLEAEQRRLVHQVAGLGAPVLLQCLPGAEGGSSGAVELYDVLQAVATGEMSRLEAVPSGARVVWPLISGYTDDTETWEQGLRSLADGGVDSVQGIAADLSPADRRRVVEVAGEEGFDKLFHGPAPSEQDFARAVARFGMQPFLERPVPLAPSRLAHNRQLAELLSSIGDLWLRLGRPETRGQSFYRAARLVDRESHDLMVLAREGNLGVVSWLDDDSRQAILEIADREVSSLLEDLRREYLESP